MADAGTAKSAAEWFQIVGLGATLGMFGQGARVIVGLKKVNDAAAAPGSDKSAGDMIQASRLLVSLLIGAIAGGLAATTTIDNIGVVTLTTLMGLAAAGYLGADFIEGFMSRFTPKDNGGDASSTTAAPATGDDAAG